MSKINHKAFYHNVFAQWSKALGPQPTADQLATAHAMVVRGPGLQALAGVAMALRDCGVTRRQQMLVSALYRPGKGTTHRNVVFGPGGLIETGDLADDCPAKGVYRAKLTPKGKALVERFTGSTLEGRMTERSSALRKAAPKKAHKAPVEAAPVGVPEVDQPVDQPQA